MRKLLWIIAFVFAPVLSAQVSNPGVQYVQTAPSGACSAAPPIQVVNSTGVIYSCNNGTWGAWQGGSGTFVQLSGDAVSQATGGATTVVGLKGVPFCTGFTPTNGQQLQYTTGSSPNPCYTAATGGGSGTVTSFSAGNLTPLFTSSVANPTTTPALTFTLSNAAQNTIFGGPLSGGSGAPSYQTAAQVLQEQTGLIIRDNYPSLANACSAAVTAAQTSGISQTLAFLNGETYTENTQCVLDTTNRACVNVAAVSQNNAELPGAGVHATLLWSGSNIPVFTHGTTNQTLGCSIHDISIGLQFNSAEAIFNTGQSRFHLVNVTVTNPLSATAQYPIVMGSHSTGGDEYELYEDNVTVAMEGASTNLATCTLVPSTGTPTSCTIGNSGGSNYHYPLVDIHGCTTPPTPTVTTSGTFPNLSIATVTFSGGSGCTGTTSAMITDVAAPYGLFHDAGDGGGGPITLQSVGTTAGMFANRGDNFWTRGQIHCYGGQPACIQDQGDNHYPDVEPDGMLDEQIIHSGYNSTSFVKTVYSAPESAVVGATLFSYSTSSSSGGNQDVEMTEAAPTAGFVAPYSYNGTFYTDATGLQSTGNTLTLLNTPNSPRTLATPVIYGQFAYAPGSMLTTSTLNLGSTTSPVEANGSAGTTGQVLTSAGTGATPTWSSPSGGGNTTSTSLTTNTVPKANGANSIVNSAMTDNGTTASYSGTGGISASAGPVSGTPPSGDAGMLALPGNTANQTIPANSFAVGGFSTASATAYGWQPNSTAPSGTQFMTAGTPSSGWSPVGYVSSTGSGNVVLATSPNLVTPVLGTPASGVITHLTGICTSCGVGGNAATATGISTSGTANQVWGMNAGATAQGWQTVSGGGGSLPTGATGQTVYYAAGGTTGTATSATTTTSASAGAPYGIGNTAPVAQLDVAGSENHLALNTANIVPTATCTATATSCAVNNVTGLNPTGGYAIMNINASGGPPEIVAYSNASVTTITFDAAATFCSGATPGRGCFGTTAASQNTAAQIVPANVMWTTANANSPALIYYWYSNAPFMFLFNGNTFSQGSTTAGFNTPTIGVGTIYLNTQGTGAANLTQGSGGLEVQNSNANPVLQTQGTTPSGVTSAVTVSATSIATGTSVTGLALPAMPAAGVRNHARCTWTWQEATTLGPVTWGIKASAAPTSLYVTYKGDSAGAYQGHVINPSITTTTITAINGSGETPAVAATNYFSEADIEMTNTANAVTLQLYGAITSGDGNVSVEVNNSSCGWLP